MIRELVLVTADIATGTPPQPVLPAQVQLRILTDMKDAKWFGGGPVNKAAAEVRFADGDCCAVAEDTASGNIIAHLWMSQRARRLEWIGCAVAPPRDHMLLYNAWVDTAFRGPGIHWALASLACATTRAAGLTKIFAGVERREFIPFARKYADMGLALIVPNASLWTFRLGSAVFRLQLPPPRKLMLASREIGSRFSCA